MSEPAVGNALAFDDTAAGPANRVPARRACLVLGAKPRIVANRTAPHGVPRVVVTPLVSGRARSVCLGRNRRAEVTAANQDQNQEHHSAHRHLHFGSLEGPRTLPGIPRQETSGGTRAIEGADFVLAGTIPKAYPKCRFLQGAQVFSDKIATTSPETQP